ncbi:hypothetical protein BGX34_012035 [Mortierella sp. NVP85]|nr:hypothetical protein BGX34_012035 [Mortierella sp. NVP85]
MTRDEYSQKFRLFTYPGLSSSDEIAIDTRQDPKTGQRFVLWRDIQLVFRNAQYIRKGGALVSFMTDEDFEDLIPHRIIYHPGITLDVVVVDSEQPQASSSSNSTSITTPTTTTTASSLYDQRTESITTSVDQLSIATSSLHTTSQGQPEVMPVEYVKACFQRLDDEMDSNRTFRAEVGIEILQNRVFRAEMIDSVQQVNSRLAILQKRIESLITQTYELHEYPIPRLFIVLPKQATRRRDKLATRRPFVQHFRLYFLCECGEHTRTEGSKISHEIHLAKHEGYDLDRPTEFFEKYGSYVLTILEMIKFGCSVAGIVVPALGHLKLGDGINQLQKSLDLSQPTAGALVDDMIKFIQDQQNNEDNNGDTPPDKPSKNEERHGLNRAEVLEGADLRRLESYLNIKDEGRALGNLYRIITPEGHVKWVCVNHYRENYRASVMQQLRDVVHANHGIFSEEFGRIHIQLSTAVVAKQFYEAMVKARGVQELDVKLGWDVTLDDLRTFASAITNASIVNLTINGQSFKGPSRDFINSGRRFDPILLLMFNGRIQSLRVDHCDEFYQRIGSPSTTTSPTLRVLHLDPKLISKDKAPLLVLRKILDKSPLLTDLTVRSDDIAVILDTITKHCPNHKLERLCLKFLGSAVNLQYSQGVIQSVKADVRRMDEITSQMNFVKKGILTAFRVKNVLVGHIQLIKGVLRFNKHLFEIELLGQARMFNELINEVTKARNDIKTEGSATALRQLRLQTDDSSSTDGQEENHDKVTMTVDFCDHSVDVNSSANVEMRSSLLTDLFEHRGSCIQNLSTNRTFDDRHAAALDKSTASQCSIKTLKLDLTSLTSAGLDSVDTIIERSKDLENLVMEFQDLADRTQQAKVMRSLILHGNLLYGLTLRGHQDALWLVEIGNALPNRSYLSKLKSLQVMCQSANIPNSCASWLAAMLQAPPKLSSSFASPSPSPSPSSSSTPVTPISPISSRKMCSWTSLTEVRIEYMVFSPKNWALIITAIDFSALELLSFEYSNFGLEQLTLLVQCIPDHDEVDVPLQALYVKNTPLYHNHKASPENPQENKTLEDLQELEAKFEEKAPLAHIKDLWPPHQP